MPATRLQKPLPNFALGQPALVCTALLLVWGTMADAATTLNYDADGNTANGLTEGNAGWNTTGGNLVWFDGTNDIVWPNTSDYIASFGGGSSGTAGNITVGTVTTNGIIFNTPSAGTYALNNGAITFSGTTPTITNNGSSVQINSAISATSLIKDGTGQLIINNSANSLGALTINNGNVDVYNTLVTTDVVVDSGGRFSSHSGTNWSMDSMVYSGSGTSNFNSYSGNSTYTIGAGGLTINAGVVEVISGDGTNTPTATLNVDKLEMSGGTLRNRTANVGASAITILKGNIAITGDSAIADGGGAGNEFLDLNGAVRTVDVATATTLTMTAVTRNGGLIKTGAGTLTLSGSESNLYTGLTTLSAGTIKVGKSGGADAIAGDILVNGGTLDWDSSNTINDGTSITLSGGSLKFDNVTETLANLTVTSGTVNDSGDTNGGLVTITGTLAASGGSGISLNSAGQWSAGTVDLTGFSGGNAIGLNGNNARLTLFTVGNGGLTLTGQTLAFNVGVNPGTAGSELALNGDVTASGTNNITVGGGAEGIAWVNLRAGIRTFNVTSGTTTSNAAFVSMNDAAGPVTPARTAVVGGLLKTGAGILQLNAVNTYTGETTINGGTLKLGAAASLDDTPVIRLGTAGTYDVSSVSGYSVKSGQTLEGKGIINGSVTADDGAIISGGLDGDAADSTLTFNNNLTLAANSVAHLDLTSSGNEKFTIGGTLTQATGAKFVIGPDTFVGALTIGQTFDLLDFGLTFNVSTNLGDNFRDGSSDSGFDLDLPNIASTGYVWDISGFATSGSVSVAVPEPVSGLLFALGLAGLGFRRQRRSSRMA